MKPAWAFIIALCLSVTWLAYGRADAPTPRQLYSAAQKLAPKHAETRSQRRKRLRNIALATADLPLPAETMAVMIAETGLSPEAHAGTARGDSGRSWCLGQVNEGNPVGAPHLGLVGLDLAATRRCAEAVSRSLRLGAGDCRRRGYPGAEAMHAAYATGNACEWSGAAARVKLTARVRARMFEALP